MERRAELLRQEEQGLAVIIMGSEADLEHSQKIADTLTSFEVSYVMRVASAHKSPEHLLAILEEYNRKKNVVYIAVAGRSNALGGFIDAKTAKPVISAPPYSDKYGGADVFSSLRMPSGIGSTVAAEPEIAAIATAKIFALNDPLLASRVLEYQRRSTEKVIDADRRISQLNQQTV